METLACGNHSQNEKQLAWTECTFQSRLIFDLFLHFMPTTFIERLVRMRTVLSGLIAITTLASGNASWAAPTLYISTDRQKLITVDPQTQTTTILGNTTDNGVPVQIWDLAFSPTGDLYGISNDNLYRVNSSNGTLSLIGNSGGPKWNALVFSDSGVLYAAGGATLSWADGIRNLYTVNPATGLAIQVGTTSTFNSSGDLAFAGGNLYITSVGSTTNELFTVDPTTAAANFVGAINVPYVFGIGTYDNTLYGAADGREVLTIDTATGAGSVLFKYPAKIAGVDTGSTTGMAIRQAQPQAQDVPGPLPIIGAGTAFSFSRKLRRRINLVRGNPIRRG